MEHWIFYVDWWFINIRVVATHQKALLKGFRCKKTHDFALFLRQ